MLDSQYRWLKRFRRFRLKERNRIFSLKLKVIQSSMKNDGYCIANIIENMRTFYGIVSFDMIPDRFKGNPELRQIYTETYRANEKLWREKSKR